MASNSLKLRAYRSRSAKERDQIILQHLPQIKYIAYRIALRLPPGIEMDDLISTGIIGLLDALEKFDETKGVQFKTYAEVRIRGAILDSLRDLDWAPRSLRKKGKEVEQAYARLEQKLGRAASDSDVAEELGMDIGEFHTLLDQLNGLHIGHFQVAYTDEGPLDGDDLPLKYSPVTADQSPFETVQKKELREMLADLVDQLPERERLVVSLYYQDELTMKEIGLILKVNESRVSQLHTRAMLRMRAKLQAKLSKKAAKQR